MGLRLMAELGLDGSGFEKGMERAHQTADRVVEGIKGFVIGAIGVATLEQAISKTVETASELVETSKRLSIAPEQLQVLRRAAKEAGSDLETLASAFEKIDIARQKALHPGLEGQDSRRAFSTLGVSIGALHSQTAAQLFMGQISASARGRNTEEIAMALRETMGKGFGQLIPTLKTDFDELGKKMKDMGAIMDTETAVKLKLLSSELGMASTILITMLGPAIVSFVELLLSLAGKIQAGFVWLETLLKKDQNGAGPADRLFNWSQAYTAQAMLDKNKKHPGILSKEDVAQYQATVNAYNAGPSAMDAAALAFDKTDEQWKAMIKRMQEALAEEAKKLRNPPRPDFSRPAEAEKVVRRALETPSDSLTRVGNFLGGLGRVGHIEQHKIRLLQQIVTNTGGHGGHPMQGINTGNRLRQGDFNDNNLRFPVG